MSVPQEKIFPSQPRTTLFLLGAVLLVGLGAFFLQTSKAANLELYGWAWAGQDNGNGYEGAGWISFNSKNCDQNNDGVSDGVAVSQGCPPAGDPIAPYGVSLQEDSSGSGTGILSGHAWSSNIGWLSFDRAEAGAPPSDDIAGPGALARLEADGTLKGWARFTSACDDVPCLNSGDGTYTGGWDGWVKLSGMTVDGTGTSYVAGALLYSQPSYGACWCDVNASTRDCPTTFPVSSEPTAPQSCYDKYDSHRPVASCADPLDVCPVGSACESDSICYRTGPAWQEYHVPSGGPALPYGVSRDTTNPDDLTGYAWGGDVVVGWISFQGTAKDGSPYVVTFSSTQPQGTFTVALAPSSASGKVPLDVPFIATVVTTNTTDDITYTFTCGNGDTNTQTVHVSPSATSYNASYTCTYSSKGTYVASVLAKQGPSSGQAQASASALITADAPISVVLTANPGSGKIPLTTTLSASVATDSTDDLTYDFDCNINDGSSVDAEKFSTPPVKSASTQCVYNDVGTITAQVTVIQGSGSAQAQAQAQTSITITPGGPIEE